MVLDGAGGLVVLVLNIVSEFCAEGKVRKIVFGGINGGFVGNGGAVNELTGMDEGALVFFARGAPAIIEGATGIVGASIRFLPVFGA